MDGIPMSAKTEKEKMLAGKLYRSADPELAADHQRAQRLLIKYNATSGEAMHSRTALLRELLGSVGDGTVIKPLFACDYGYNIRLGGTPLSTTTASFSTVRQLRSGTISKWDQPCSSTPRPSA
jgi:maltose O-acetyltransferase